MKQERESHESISISTLRRVLEGCMSPDSTLCHHGTASETWAQSIMQQGIGYSDIDIGRVAKSVFDPEKSWADQDDKAFETFLHWPHKNAPYIVFISAKIPEGRRSNLDDLFQDLPEGHALSQRFKYHIPPRFIQGYLDVGNVCFLENPLFDPEAEIPEPVLRLKRQIPQKIKGALTPTSPKTTNHPPKTGDIDPTEIF